MAADFFHRRVAGRRRQRGRAHRPDDRIEDGPGRHGASATRSRTRRTASPRCSRSSTPNLAAKPDTVLFNKVTIKGAKQAVQMFGPAQAAVAAAVVDSVESGVIPKDKADD